MTFGDTYARRSGFTIEGQKRPQIAFRDADDTADSVHHEIAGLDPPADRTGGDLETFRDLGDREELELIVAAMASTHMAESSRFHAVAGGPSSSTHARPPSHGEAPGTAVPEASIRWKATFGTNRSRPILIVGMSPRFAAS